MGNADELAIHTVHLNMDHSRTMTFEGRGGFCGQVWIPETNIMIYPASDNHIPRAAVVKTKDTLAYIDVRTDAFPHRVANVKRPLVRRCARDKAL